MTYIYDDFRFGNSNGDGPRFAHGPVFFSKKMKVTYIYDVFRILFLEEEEAPERMGVGGEVNLPPPL